MNTSRRTQPFEVKHNKDKTRCTYTSMVPISAGHDIQLIAFSFAGDMKERPLGAILESITLRDNKGLLFMEELTGNMLIVRNALMGIRSSWDKDHNRTHIVITDHTIKSEEATLLTVTLEMKQFTEDELKTTFKVKTNDDLFHDPELFVATGKHETPSGNIHISPIKKFETKVPYLEMDDHKQFSIKMKDFAPLPPSIFQIWFMYSVLNTPGTSSMYGVLNWNHDGNIAHSYSSPVQVQVLDKQIYGLFSTVPAARTMQEKYQTITVGRMSREDLEKCELQFVLHEQFFRDYSTCVSEAKDKTKLVKDVEIIVQFGFLYHE